METEKEIRDTVFIRFVTVNNRYGKFGMKNYSKTVDKND